MKMDIGDIMDGQHILTIFGLVFASTGFWTFLNNYIERKSKKRSVTEEALLALLHDKIYYLSKRYISECQISDSEHKNLNILYLSYKALGGNGTAERLIKEVETLPIREG